MKRKNYKWTFILPAVVGLLNGCGIYTSYHRPDTLPLDSLYRDVPTHESDSSLLADVSWRELFSDPCLVKWIEMGLEKNSDLQIAHLRTQEAQASLQASRLAFLPALSLSAEGSLSSYAGAKPTKSYSVGGVADWEIDVFGKLQNAKKGSMAAWEASRAYEQAVQTQLIATIAETYYSLVLLDYKQSITRETLATWQTYLQSMRALKRAGERNDAAVAQTEASCLDAELAVLSIERQIRELEHSFAALLGMVPSSIERGESLVLSFPESWSVGIPVQLLSKRPDVRQKEWQLAQAFYATNEARASFYPKITLSGSVGWTNNGGGGISNPGDWLMNAVGSLLQPLFNRGKNWANLKISQAQQEEAQITFVQQLLNAGAEVNDALTQWQTARKSLELDRMKVKTLETAVRSTQLLMDHGDTNYLEVLAARQTLLQARLAEVTDQYEEIQGIISLYHALGGGTQ